MLNKTLLILTLFSLVSCRYGEFKIKEGKHYSGTHFSLFSGESLSIMFQFDDSAVYQTKEPNNQKDINKLFGFSDCGNRHHKNSIRLGWRWLNEQLEIHSYSYVNSERKHKLITTVPLNEPIPAEIKVLPEGSYLVTVNGITVKSQRGCTGKHPLGYILFPYFGGDETAPHDILITVLNSKKKLNKKPSRKRLRQLKKHSKSQYLLKQ